MSKIVAQIDSSSSLTLMERRLVYCGTYFAIIESMNMSSFHIESLLSVFVASLQHARENYASACQNMPLHGIAIALRKVQENFMSYPCANMAQEIESLPSFVSNQAWKKLFYSISDTASSVLKEIAHYSHQITYHHHVLVDCLWVLHGNQIET